jgi:putative hydrolase of the HAD superfamily
MPCAKSGAAANRCSMALASQFDSFIFDYGCVLVSDQTEEDKTQMARVMGVDVDTFQELYWSDRLEYDRGSESGYEYWLRLGSQAGKTLSADAIDRLTELDSRSWMHFDEPMWEWIAQLRAAGKPVAILSNMPRELGEALRAQTDRLSRVDHVTLSYELNSVKPEPAIYEHALEGVGTEPGRTLFLDDRITNVQGAELLGIQALQFTSRDEVLLRLRA